MAGISLNNTAASADAIRHLDDASNSLASTYQRLSSGQRINKASDDAAGLAIASSLEAKTRIFTQGVRNVNDAQSVLSIADSTLGALTGIVTRLSELSEEASNGTLSNTQRTSLDREAQALSKEYTRISSSAKFNGIGIFDGSLANGLNVQAGLSKISSQLGGNLATGTFGNFAATAPSASPSSQALIDVNGDGIPDLIAANGASVTVSFGNGDGSFALASSTAVAATSISVGDFNNDGSEDFVVGGGTSATAFLNNGNGTFAAIASFSAASSVLTVGLGDFNGDGNLDLVYTDLSNHVMIRNGNGNGSFAAAATYTLGFNVKSLAIGDLNGDGISDLAVVSTAYYTNTVASVLLANGNGTLRAASNINAGTVLSYNTNSIKIGDVNGDGILDIVSVATAISSSTGMQTNVVLGNGNGTFMAALTNTITGGIAGGAQLALSDLNSDGKLDIVVSSSNQAYLLNGNGNGTFNFSTTFNNGGAIALGDINRDGATDILLNNQRSLVQTVSGVNPLLQFSLRTNADAHQALSYFTNTLGILSSQRATVGAFQSRTASAITTLQSAAEQYTAAKGRITDADVADDAANLARFQILQQSAAAVLEQQNHASGLVLKLIT